MNRRAGALWALAEEPDIEHVIGQSRDFSMLFFEDVLPLRIAADGTLRDVPPRPAALGNFRTKSTEPPTDAAPVEPTAWLLSDRLARAWTRLVGGGQQ